MIDIKKNYINDKQEVAILVGIRHPAVDRLEVEEHLNELQDLAKTAGALVKQQIIQERATPDSAYFIGKGKIDQLKEIVEEHEANLVIFDDELTPAQVRNISVVLEGRAPERSGDVLGFAR